MNRLAEARLDQVGDGDQVGKPLVNDHNCFIKY